MASKPSQKPSAASGSLVQAVRDNMTQRRQGFAPWFLRIAPQHAAELEQLRAAWHRGELGSVRRPVVREVLKWLQANAVADVGEQGVDAWLRVKP